MDKTSLGFQKPKEEEYYDINIFNQNAQLANDLIEKNSSAIGQIAEKTLQGKVYTTENLYKPADIANLKIGKVYGIIGDGTTVDGVTYHKGYGYNLMVYGHSVDLEGNVAVTQILTCTYNHQYEKRILYRNYYLSSGGWSTWRTLSSEVCNPNLLINGDFQIWQRGTNFDTDPYITYTADRWYIWSSLGNTVKVEKTDKGIKMTRLAGSGGVILSQILEEHFVKRLKGKALTVSAYLKGGKGTLSVSGANSAGSIPVIYTQKDCLKEGVHSSNVLIPEDAYKHIAVTFNISGIAVGESVEIEWIKLELEEIATPLSPRSYGEELALCQRYFEKSYSIDITPGSTSIGGIEVKIVPNNTMIATQKYGKTSFKVAKRVSPSIVIYPYTNPANTGRVSNHSGQDLGEGSGEPFQVGTDGFTTYNKHTTQTTAGYLVMFHWTADAEIY